MGAPVSANSPICGDPDNEIPSWSVHPYMYIESTLLYYYLMVTPSCNKGHDKVVPQIKLDNIQATCSLLDRCSLLATT